MKKILIIDPYIDTLGGGEKYVLDIADVLNNRGYNVTLHSSDKTILNKIRNRFNIKTDNFNLIDYYSLNKLSKFNFLKSFEKVIYVTDGSYFYCPAKENYLLAMYPKEELYQPSLTNKIKWRNWNFFCFSSFTKNYIDQWIGKKCYVIYPKIDQHLLNINARSRKNVILSVGRFFGQLHTKNHVFLIDSFNKLQQRDKAFKNFELILIGGLKQEDDDYYRKIFTYAKTNKNIKFLTNASNQELLKNYQQAMFYWHASGIGINEKVYPEKVEHFGITPFEAMAAGAIPFVYPVGELKSLIDNGNNGFIYNNQQELIDKTIKIYSDKQLKSKITANGRKFIKDNLDGAHFEENVVNFFKL